MSIFTSSSTDFNRYSFASSEVKPEILSSSCTPFSCRPSTSFSFFLTLASFAAISFSRRSNTSAFLSTDSSFDKTRFSYFCSSALRSRVSFSTSFFVRRDSSFASSRASRFLVSAVFSASSMMFLAFSSAVPIFSASCLILLSTAIFLVTGTAISNVTTTAMNTSRIVIPVPIPGAPPYLVFIAHLQHYNFILFSQICQCFKNIHVIYCT